MSNQKIDFNFLVDEEIINVINVIKKLINNKNKIDNGESEPNLQVNEIEFNEIDLNLIKKYLNKKSILDDINIKKEIKRKIHSIFFNSKEKELLTKKSLSLNNNKYFQLIIYIYILVIIKKKKEAINKDDEKKYEIVFKNIFLLLVNMYKAKILSFISTFKFFNFYLKTIKYKDLSIKDFINNLMFLLNLVKKVIKIANNYEYNNPNEKEITKELINKNIHRIFEHFFVMNNKIQITDIIYDLNLIKYPKLLNLLKFCYDYYENNIIDKENINFIKSNLVKLMSNNLNFGHLNFFYNISKKYLLNYNNKIKSKKNYLILLNGIIEFFMEIKKNEILNLETNSLYCDKYFIFDSSDENSGIKTSSIPININSEYGLFIIFSFYAIKEKDSIDNKAHSILSYHNESNTLNYLKIYLDDNNLELFYHTGKSHEKILLMDNIDYETFYLCGIYHIKEKIYFFLQDKSKEFNYKFNLTKINNLCIEIGYDSFKNEKFNGIIGPVLIFNSNINDISVIFNKIRKNLKEKYYLIGEQIRQETKNTDNKNNETNIFFSYEEYNGALNVEKDIIKLVNEIKNSLGNLLLYINPEIFINNLNFIDKSKFRDCQIYNNCFNNDKNQKDFKNNIYYEFLISKEITNMIWVKNNIIKFFINNKGFNFIILNLEIIYNYLLIYNNLNIDENTFILM